MIDRLRSKPLLKEKIIIIIIVINPFRQGTVTCLVRPISVCVTAFSNQPAALRNESNATYWRVLMVCIRYRRFAYVDPQYSFEYAENLCEYAQYAYEYTYLRTDSMEQDPS